MKKIALGMALLLSATVAQAALVCSNDRGQSLRWQWGHPKPDVSNATFDIRAQRDVKCFLNSYALANGAGVANMPYIAIASNNDAGPGLIYTGDMARWLILNLPSASGVYNFRADFDALPY